ncbi:AAA family ATPase [Streptomyces sp. Ru87]|uniref:AAA family ATPase n=1 Tax=Streptomyces sp. Ru87 TaxID=2044307 RepID=UPI000BF95FB3|nr:LuxR family transcriptional regulator [Streptomyces sp. Ru87]PGH49104.1 helix-turn-helix transcriptional regulator [Streptomyces sp. Ru87]
MNGSRTTGSPPDDRADASSAAEEQPDERARLERISAEAARARAGSGRLVLIRGGTGTGRSTLLETVVRRESWHGMRVLRARCSREESGTAYAAVAQLLDAELPAAARSVARARPAPGRRRAHRIRAARQGRDSLHGTGLPARLWRLLRSYAARGPVLLAVDDAHLADASSRRWLTQAARMLDQLPVLLVMTERVSYDIDPSPSGMARALPPALVTVCATGPLRPAEVADTVRARFGDATPRGWADECFRATGGNPLLLHALLADLAEVTGPAGPAGPSRPAADAPGGHGTPGGHDAPGGHGAPGGHDAPAGDTSRGPLPGAPCDAPVFPERCADLYPGNFTAAVAWWLECAGPATGTAARTLAELENAGTPELLTPVTGADPDRTAGWAGWAVRQGLLVRAEPGAPPRYPHPLLRDAVLAGWPRERRQAVRRDVAEILYRRGDSAEAVVRHLLSAPAVGADWAANALLEAASNAVREHRPHEAGNFLRRALDEPLTRERRGEVLTELGCLEFNAGRPVGVRHLTEALPLRHHGSGRLRTTVALGTALAGAGDVPAALETLRALGEEHADQPGTARVTQAAGALLAAYDGASWLRVVAGLRHVAAHSPARLDQAERAMLVRYEATAGLVSADEAVARLCSVANVPVDPALSPYVLATVAAVLQWADRNEEADQILGRGLAGHSPSLLHPSLQSMANTRADAAVARGRYEELLADRDAWDISEHGPHGSTNVRAQAMLALIATNRIARAERLSLSITASGSRDSWEWNRFLYARGVLRATLDDHSGALADFMECGRRQSARDVLSPVVTPWRSAAAECLRRMGSTAAAVALAEEEHRLAVVWGTPRTIGRALRVLGTVTGGRRGLKLSRQAVELLRTAPAGACVGPELLAALISLGGRLQAAGDRGKARTVLREAVARAQELHEPRMLELAERALSESGARAVGARRSGADALTESELRIAALAAEGRTNAEIAELLHLARRTVETHLTSAYRKLGIQRRSGLPGALGVPKSFGAPIGKPATEAPG